MDHRFAHGRAHVHVGLGVSVVMAVGRSALTQWVRVDRGSISFEFKAPNAKFVCATLGQTERETAEGNEKLILEAQLAVDGTSGKHPEFKGNTATVYTHPLSQGGASNSHYNGNAQTYMDVGTAMGEAMIHLLRAK